MSNSNVPNKTTALVLNQKISEGVDKYFSKVKSLTVGGTTYTPKSLMAVLNAENEASSAVDSTRVQLGNEVAATARRRSRPPPCGARSRFTSWARTGKRPSKCSGTSA